MSQRKKESGFIIGSILIMRTIVIFKDSARKKKSVPSFG